GCARGGVGGSGRGLVPEHVVALVDLVRHPPPLPSFPTGRDLDDPATVAVVADAAGSEDGLDLLRALTVADSLATGPTAWGAWKESLVDRLVAVARAELRRRAGATTGEMSPARPDGVRDPRLDRFDGTPVLEQRTGGVTLVAPDALGLLAVEVAVLGVHAQNVRRARTFTVEGVAIGEFDLEPERGREPDWDAVAADLRVAVADPASIRDRLAARGV